MKYNIVLADPPWHYNTRFDGKMGSRGRGKVYSTMSKEELELLPINKITNENCVLFLWVTAPCLIDGIELIKKWGFTYKTVAFTWVKRNKKSPSWFWGMGYWTRANPEFCLIGTKGKIKRISASVHSIIDTPIEEHSKKPDEVRNRIVSLMGDLPRVELFARQKVEGWTCIGNDINGKDIKQELIDLAKI